MHCRAQGTAQGVEDGALLGHLFDEDAISGDIPARLKRFCDRWQSRVFTVRSRSRKTGEIYQLPDGPTQERRDQ